MLCVKGTLSGRAGTQGGLVVASCSVLETATICGRLRYGDSILMVKVVCVNREDLEQCSLKGMGACQRFLF